jgi:hypothetical protein
LVKVLDLAVKSGGLNAAITCLPIAQEIEKQLYVEPQPQTQPQSKIPNKADLEAQKMVEEIIKEKSTKNKKN